MDRVLAVGEARDGAEEEAVRGDAHGESKHDNPFERANIKPDLLPENSPLPGPEEFDIYDAWFEATASAHPDWIFSDNPSKRIFRHEDLVIKYGVDPITTGTTTTTTSKKSQELATLQFIRQHTSIPVPRAWSHGPHVIIMEFVPGETIRDAWAHLSAGEKQTIAEDLRGFLAQLRGLESTCIGGVDGGPVYDIRHQCSSGGGGGGPFASEHVFHDWLARNIPRDTTRHLHIEALRATRPTDSKIHFCHSDLGGQNILVREGRIAAVLDWEYAGWFPEWWEYARFVDHSVFEAEWHGFGRDIFPKKYHFQVVRDCFYGSLV